jgi:hypothetical protein
MSTIFHRTRNGPGSTLAVAHLAASGVLVVAAGHGVRFGTPSPSAPLWLTCADSASGVVLTHVEVTAVVGDVLTVSGAAPGYSDVPLPIGTLIESRPTRELMDELQNAVNAAESAITAHTGSTSNPHSVTAAQVGAYTSGQIDTLLTSKANDNAVVHLTGAQSVPALLTLTNGLIIAASIYANAKPLQLGNAGVDGVYWSVADLFPYEYPGAKHSIVASIGSQRHLTGIAIDLCADGVSVQERVVTLMPDQIMCHKPLTGATSGTPISLGAVGYYADDTAAAVGGVAVGQLYRTASTLKIRVS